MPIPSNPTLFNPISTISGLAGAEITAFDPESDRLFVVDGSSTLQIFDLSDPANPVADGSISLSGTANSVAVNNGVVAVAIQASTVTDNGTVAFYNAATNALIDSTEVGALPDMLTFTPDGTKVLVANEGEADGSVDPEGSISIIDFDGTQISNVATADFDNFSAATLRASGVRIFPNKTAAEDLEPEYIAVSDDGATAYVTLQENNAVAVVDIATATVTEVRPLGTQDHSVAGNELDASDDDNTPGNLQNWPVLGLYQPDGIATFAVGGQTYTITANEGDSRNEDERIKDLTLDPTIFADAATLQEDENLGRLEVSTVDGDLDGDGDYDQLFSYGGRSFTIRDASGAIVFDSGSEFEQIVADNMIDIDNRSDNKGAEPEGVTVGVIDGRTYAFIGLERAEGVVVYDVTTPTAPTYVQFLQTAGDEEPEGLTFIPFNDSPNGDHLLVVANEDSETISIYSTPECFVTGTHVLTEQGEKRVEELVIGDRVQTANGESEPIKWIGRQTVKPEDVQNPMRGYPIRIKAGALGNHLPVRDLYVSPDHAVLVDGLLINAGALVNSVSIIQTEPTDVFTYFHIELEKHALLIAEGTYAESYLPQKEDRDCYDNAAEYSALYPDGPSVMLWPLDYPRVSSYTTVPRYVRQRLRAIANNLDSEVSGFVAS